MTMRTDLPPLRPKAVVFNRVQFQGREDVKGPTEEALRYPLPPATQNQRPTEVPPASAPYQAQQASLAISPKDFVTSITRGIDSQDHFIGEQLPMFFNIVQNQVQGNSPDKPVPLAKAQAAESAFRKGFNDIQKNDPFSLHQAVSVALTMRYFLAGGIQTEQISPFMTAIKDLTNRIDVDTFHQWIIRNELQQKIPPESADAFPQLEQLLKEVTARREQVKFTGNLSTETKPQMRPQPIRFGSGDGDSQEINAGRFMERMAEIAGAEDPILESQIPMFWKMLVWTPPEKVISPELYMEASQAIATGLSEIADKDETGYQRAVVVGLTAKYLLVDALTTEEIVPFMHAAQSLVSKLNVHDFHELIVQNRIEESIPLNSVNPLANMQEQSELMSLKFAETPKKPAKTPRKRTKKTKTTTETEALAQPEKRTAVQAMQALIGRFSPLIADVSHWEKFHKHLIDKESDPEALNVAEKRLEQMLSAADSDYGLRHAFNQIFESNSNPEYRLAATDILFNIFKSGGNPQFFANLMTSRSDIKSLTPPMMDHHFGKLHEVIATKQSPKERNGLYVLINQLLNNNLLTQQPTAPLSLTEAINYSYMMGEVVAEQLGQEGWARIYTVFRRAQTKDAAETFLTNLKKLSDGLDKDQAIFSTVILNYFSSQDIAAAEKEKKVLIGFKGVGITRPDVVKRFTNDYYYAATIQKQLEEAIKGPHKEALKGCVELMSVKTSSREKLEEGIKISKQFAEKGGDPVAFAQFFSTEMPYNVPSIYDSETRNLSYFSPLAETSGKMTTPQQKTLFKELITETWRNYKKYSIDIKFDTYHYWVAQAVKIADVLPQSMPLKEKVDLALQITGQKKLLTDGGLNSMLAQFKALAETLESVPGTMVKELFEKFAVDSYGVERSKALKSILNDAKAKKLDLSKAPDFVKTILPIVNTYNCTDAQVKTLMKITGPLATQLAELQSKGEESTAPIAAELEQFQNVWNQLVKEVGNAEALGKFEAELKRPPISKALLDKLSTRYSSSNEKQAFVFKLVKRFSEQGGDAAKLVEILTERHNESDRYDDYSLYDVSRSTMEAVYLKPVVNYEKYTTPAHKEFFLDVLKRLYAKAPDRSNSIYDSNSWVKAFDVFLNTLAILPESVPKDKKLLLLDKWITHFRPSTLSEELPARTQELFNQIVQKPDWQVALADLLTQKPDLASKSVFLTDVIKAALEQKETSQQFTTRITRAESLLNQLPANLTKEQVTEIMPFFSMPTDSIAKLAAGLQWMKENNLLDYNQLKGATPLEPNLSLLMNVESPDKFLDSYMLNLSQIHPQVMYALFRYIAETANGKALGSQILPELMASMGPYAESLAGRQINAQDYSTMAVKALATTKSLRLTNVEPLEYDNYARLGVMGLSFPKWKYDTQSRWKGQGTMERPPLFEQSNLFRKIGPRTDDKTFHGGFHRYDPKTGVSLEMRRGYVVISKPGFGTLVIRNSGTTFGRDLLAEPAYYHPHRVYTTGQDLFYPEGDLSESYQGETFQSVFSSNFQDATKKKPTHEKIKGLMDELDKTLLPYLEWKYGFKQGKPSTGIKELITASLLSAKNQGGSTPFKTKTDISLSWVNRFGVPYPVRNFDVKDPQNLEELEFFDRVLNKENRVLSSEEYRSKMPRLMEFLTFGLENKLELVLSE